VYNKIIIPFSEVFMSIMSVLYTQVSEYKYYVLQAKHSKFNVSINYYVKNTSI
jgi:hypothetical protein